MNNKNSFNSNNLEIIEINLDFIKLVIENANFPLDRVLNFNEDLFKEYFKID